MLKLETLPATKLTLNRKEVCQIAGVSYPTIWSWMRDNSFPKSVKIGEKRVAWRTQEVLQWLETRPRTELKGG